MRTYAHLKADAIAAIKQYAADVRSGDFPGDGESYHLPDEVVATFGRDAAVGDPEVVPPFYGDDDSMSG